MALDNDFAYISIHAPREGGDRRGGAGRHHHPCDFNPRPPRGGRHKLVEGVIPTGQFQSTPPARGATPSFPLRDGRLIFQSTPPARGATLQLPVGQWCVRISIHAPREGGDCSIYKGMLRRSEFQSTPPARGATTSLFQKPMNDQYFNPRPPRGGRPACGLNLCCQAGFQSTPPARGATRQRPCCPMGSGDFNPRPPRGGRRRDCQLAGGAGPISIHAPREGGDLIPSAMP